MDFERLREIAIGQGISLFGVADLDPLRVGFHESLAGAAAGLPVAVSLGLRLSQAVLEGIRDRPTLLYKHHYQAVNYRLDQAALLCCAAVQEEGFAALPVPASQIVDWRKRRGHLSHRAVAAQAGLGWIGRSGLLVNPRFGAQARYVTLLTNAPLAAGKPVEGGCGGCRDCLAACPAGAISEGGVDHEKCFAKLREFSKSPGIGQFICGACVKACPGAQSALP